MLNKTDIRSMDPEELKRFLSTLDEKPYRADQVFSWLHEKKATGPDEMTNIPGDLRNKLKETCDFSNPSVERMLESALDGTRKYLFRFSDGSLIESVLMKYSYGNSVCVSSQAGCRMGCRFCASTLNGLSRNLTPSEMLGQVYEIERRTGERVSHVVIMGSGEPFDNYDNVVRFIRLLIHPKGKNLSARNITLSTCGLTDGIDRFSKEDLPVTLALSLHAPDQALRKSLMPAAARYELQEVLSACDRYFERTHRRITYEYSLMHGINDSKETAEKLAALLNHRQAHVNLIPVNPVSERDFEKPDRDRILVFRKTLEKNGIHVTMRKTMGSDIDGACGQLRYHVMKE